MRPRRPAAQSGFTLIEVLVALAILAVMALMGWRAIDGLMRAQQGTQAHHEQAERAQMALLQWQLDLNAVQADARTPALQFDGNSLCVVRRSALSQQQLQVVAWRVRDGQWSRWTSPPLSRVDELEQAWRQAQSWGQGQWQSPSQLDLISAENWSIYYYRVNAWSNPLSASATQATASASSPPSEPLPTGIRLQLDRPGADAFSGRLQLDWVSPLWTSGS